MDITRRNFKESLGQIESAIKESSFLAIDGEFTGLNHAGLSPSGVFDTPEERYHKLVQGASDFLVIQFGICTFTYNKSTNKYTAKPFNFYIFPRPLSRAAPDLRFSCQSSSLDFLMSQGFDFNKWVKDGISFMRPADEARLRDQIQKKHEVLASPAYTTPGGASQPGAVNKGPVEVPPEQQDFVDEICKKVGKFVESGEHDSLSLPSVSAFQRKLTYQTLQAKFGSEVHLQSKTGESRERYIVVTRVRGEAQMKQIEANKQTQDMMEIDDAVGFTHVIKMISQSGKLVVGHNILLDIAHTINQFMYPLPSDYQDFKSMCRCVFPRLIDTKLLANTQPFKDMIDNSGLSGLLHISQFAPFVKPDVEISEEMDNRYKGTESLHEAGYDAYITGQCFISLANYLGNCQKPPSDHTEPTSPLLEPFLNKIFMMRSQDIPYMDLTAPDLNPSRDHVFHLTFPNEWKTSDISGLFSSFGSVYIGWLDDKSAYVSLHYSSTPSSSVMKTLCKKGSVYRLMTYKDHHAQVNQYHWTPSKPHPPGHAPPPHTPPTSTHITPTHHHNNHSGQGHYQTGHEINPTHHINHSGQGHYQTGHDLHEVQGHLNELQKGVKRTHSPQEDGSNCEDGGSSAKKSKALNAEAPEFQSRITPNSTPEKEDAMKWPENIASGEKKIEETNTSEDKMFAEPTDW